MMYYQSGKYKGYEIQYTPPHLNIKVCKKFTKSKISMEERKQLAIDFLKSLHLKYGTNFEHGNSSET